MMMPQSMWFLLPAVLAFSACDKKAVTSDKPGEAVVANPQRSCTHLVAKLSECVNGKELNQRFTFSKLKDWMYEDCEKLKLENKTLFDNLMSCVSLDCSQMESCLERVLGKWQENRK
ncbi:MAG: hypothetical protein CVU59_00380 [Deltaproteobacteria bacterium HGW-Deltaproteobacteria-17]|nr:MAG: hypothetical protein CVU59_00380 [Deltaproteobacteria bacterium HGW-Deltaproteobacteria-17]